jgi:serine/threonine-protein kinase
MGDVYRARDRQLNRQVALKVLPDVFALDPDRLDRFKREAQVLASLNHPNIASIHGFEESDGLQALVLELIDGPTLADRIAHGPIPLDEGLPIARQIAEGLEAAHEQGIVHRDQAGQHREKILTATRQIYSLTRIRGPDAVSNKSPSAAPARL